MRAKILFIIFRPLGDRHLLFDGRRDKQWVNTPRGRCHDLRCGDVLVVKSFSGSQMCDMDRFTVADWFEWPWYRRWPWTWGDGERVRRARLASLSP